MAAKVKALHDAEVFIGNKPFKGTVWMFHCPACKFGHWFAEGEWQWNHNAGCPDVKPSIVTNRCHLFIRNGKLDYCSDSNHEYAGKVIAMEDWE